ncbi:MAG TPA: hypothetical protein PLB04_04900 [Nitrospira sp.]|nr:hypothetical protein [Nitrospira sp.]
MAYNPHPAPTSPDQLTAYVYEELLRISGNLGMIEEGRFLSIRATAPEKPREGMLALADGTNWNPGSGKGLYEYKSGGWSKL